MNFLPACIEIFKAFFKMGLKSKKARLFFLLSCVPAIIMLIVKIVEISNPSSNVLPEKIYSIMLFRFYIQFLIPILALFFGSMVINEEVENKTLLFLTTSPVPKPAIIVGKFLAFLAVTIMVINIPLILSYLILNMNHFGQMVYLQGFLQFFGAGILALMVYLSFFTLIGTWLKKPMIVGLVYIFGLERIIKFFPGITQKLTFIHYIKSLVPQPYEGAKFLAFQLSPSSPTVSILALLIFTGIFLIISSKIFVKKEFIMSDSA